MTHYHGCIQCLHGNFQYICVLVCKVAKIVKSCKSSQKVENGVKVAHTCLFGDAHYL